MALSVRNAAPFRSYLAEIGRVRPLYFCPNSKPAAHSPPRPPLANASRPPPLPVGAILPCSPTNTHSKPIITFAIPSIPSRVPTLPPASVRPSSPLALGRSGRSVRSLAAPRAAPGGFDYIFYTTQNHYSVSALAYHPHTTDFYTPLSLPSAELERAPASAGARSTGVPWANALLQY